MHTFSPKVLLVLATAVGTAFGAEENSLLEHGRIADPASFQETTSQSLPTNNPGAGIRFEHDSKITFQATDKFGAGAAEPFVVPTGKYLISDHFSCAGNNLESGVAYIIRLQVRTSGNAKNISQISVPAILGLSGEGTSIDQEVEINAGAGTAIQILGQAGGGPIDRDSSVDCRLAGYMFDTQ